jgi:hypothetical protein
VKLTMEAVCVLLGLDTEWNTAKWLLGQGHFVHLLQNVDINKIPRKVMDRLIREYFNNPEFSYDVVARQSMAAGGLCKWVRALVMYDNVLRKSQREAHEREQYGSRIDIPTGRAERSETETDMSYEVIEATEFDGLSLSESESQPAPQHYQHYQHASTAGARVGSKGSKARPLTAPKTSKSMDELEFRRVEAVRTRPATAAGPRRSTPAPASAAVLHRSANNDGKPAASLPQKRTKPKTAPRASAQANFSAPTRSSASKALADSKQAPLRSGTKGAKSSRSVPHVLDTLLRK